MISSSDIHNARILIVDDQDVNVELLEQMLRGDGYVSIASTRNPQEVCELHRRHHYSLILLDLLMPGMDGFQVMEGLQAIDTQDYVPVLVLTAQPDYKLRALNAGARDFIGKPFNLPEVLSRVRNLLEMRLLHSESKLRAQQAQISEQRIQVSELNYRRLFEAARDGILILDGGTGRITDVNPYLTELLGYSLTEMVGKTVGELSPDADTESNRIILGQLQHHGHAHYENLPLQTRAGVNIEVEYACTVYDVGGRDLIQCNVRDITERKRSEAAIKNNEARLRQIIDLVPIYIFAKDQEGHFLLANRTFAEAYGKTPAEVEGMTQSELCPNEAEACRYLQADREVIESGKPKFIPEESSTAACGTVQFLQTTKIPFTFSGTREPAVLGASVVITEFKRAKQEVQELNVTLEQRVDERTAQLEVANKELQAFSYSVSHDLRAPLRHILGFVKLLQMDAGPSLSKEHLRHLTTISQSAREMTALIDDLLAFSEIGYSEIEKTDVSLDQLVREASSDLQAEAKDRKIDWQIGVLPTVWADRALLRMVLVNLLSNAIKFTGIRAEARIEIGCDPSVSGEAVVFIRDNGAGFDSRYADKLFNVFQRLHRQEEFTGTGIGLANVKRIIERHGGRVWATSVEGEGATFYFSLPQRSVVQLEEPARSATVSGAVAR